MSHKLRSVVPRAKRIRDRIHSRIPRAWHLFNADKKTVGRLAGAVAHLLQGKHKPVYTGSRDVGDFVVIVNAEHVEFKGKSKWKKKVYRHHTGYPGGLKEYPAKLIRATKPERILERAVAGMLPKTQLRKKQMSRLKVYAGDIHPHDRQIQQIPEEDFHQEDFMSHMQATVVDTYWENFPNFDELLYKNDEDSPEGPQYQQADLEDAEEIITGKNK